MSTGLSGHVVVLSDYIAHGGSHSVAVVSSVGLAFHTTPAIGLVGHRSRSLIMVEKAIFHTGRSAELRGLSTRRILRQIKDD